MGAPDRGGLAWLPRQAQRHGENARKNSIFPSSASNPKSGGHAARHGDCTKSHLFSHVFISPYPGKESVYEAHFLCAGDTRIVQCRAGRLPRWRWSGWYRFVCDCASVSVASSAVVANWRFGCAGCVRRSRTCVFAQCYEPSVAFPTSQQASDPARRLLIFPD